MATATLDAALAEALAARGLADFDAAFVLGSGLSAFADRLEDASVVPFAEVEGMPESRVPGHPGRFVLGRLGGLRILVQAGRVHLYEGWSPQTVVRSVRAFARLGCERLLLTNAAGGLARDWPVPCLMRVSDHLALQIKGPLRPGEGGRGSPYDPELGQALERAARTAKVELFEGVYAGLDGPAYETPAEIALLGGRGAAAVGMSTVAEAVAAQASGMRVAAVSCIANRAAGIADGPLDHAQVVAAGETLAEDFGRLLAAFAVELA